MKKIRILKIAALLLASYTPSLAMAQSNTSKPIHDPSPAARNHPGAPFFEAMQKLQQEEDYEEFYYQEDNNQAWSDFYEGVGETFAQPAEPTGNYGE